MAHVDPTQVERVHTEASSKIKRLGRSLRDACFGKPRSLIDEKPTDGTSTGKKDQDGHGMMKSENFLRSSEPIRRIEDFFVKMVME